MKLNSIRSGKPEHSADTNLDERLFLATLLNVRPGLGCEIRREPVSLRAWAGPVPPRRSRREPLGFFVIAHTARQLIVKQQSPLAHLLRLTVGEIGQFPSATIRPLSSSAFCNAAPLPLAW
jgi:hypothetical protein